ncbi:MAG: hypothetical protein IJ509_02395, partial [Bacilli bacterium]|nr:hypothetical protein [Bacilli bacterium]
ATTLIVGLNNTWSFDSIGTTSNKSTALMNGSSDQIYCWKSAGYLHDTSATKIYYYPVSGTATEYTGTNYSTIVSSQLVGYCSGSVYVQVASSLSGVPINRYTSELYTTKPWYKMYVKSSNVSTSSGYYSLTSITDTITVSGTKYYAVWANERLSTLFPSLS